ncbi:MAG: TRAP transporter small permease subunit [Paracoccaceae bacterium]
MSDGREDAAAAPRFQEPDEVPHSHHTALPQTAPSRAIDKGLTLLGKAFSWLWLVVVGVIIYAVVGRYAFGQGSVGLEEWQWHLASAAWLVGLAYVVVTDDHVRVDIIHERMSLKTQAWIELFGLLVLLGPFLVLAIYEAWPYAYSSYLQDERSQAPAGLANRWILKFVLTAAFVLLLVAAVSRLMRVTALLFGVPSPKAIDDQRETG